MILASTPTFDTIYFIIPANTYNSNSLSYVAVDKNVGESIEISLKEYEANSTKLKQVTYAGINSTKIKFKFTVKNEASDDILLISKYFESLLGTQAFTLYNTFIDENNYSIIVPQWNITYTSSLYGDIGVDAELVY